MNSQMIVRTCCKLTLDDWLQPNNFALLNILNVKLVSVPVVSKYSND